MRVRGELAAIPTLKETLNRSGQTVVVDANEWPVKLRMTLTNTRVAKARRRVAEALPAADQGSKVTALSPPMCNELEIAYSAAAAQVGALSGGRRPAAWAKGDERNARQELWIQGGAGR